MKSKWRKYAIAAVIGATLAVIYLTTRDFGTTEDQAERYRMLCDAFTIPGMLLIMSAALVALSNAGSFTGLGFSVGHMFRSLIPGASLRQESYADYLERREGKKVKGYGFLLQVGLVFMAVALVFFFLFYRVYSP